jgi:glycosyltransferase involved in cell wall biosynthesis
MTAIRAVPSVSVVIPVKDDAPRLRECLTALARQQVLPLEIVVVDNASTDDSAEVARRAGARVVREDRPGIPAASTTGYDAARGEVIARLDADSVPPPHWVGAVALHFAAHPEVSAVTGGAEFSGGPKVLRRVGAALYLGAYYVSLAPALGHVPVFGSNFAMRRDAWEAVRFAVHRNDPEVHDDLDLSFHLGAGRRIRYLRGIAVLISHRPFTDAGSVLTRFGRGFRSVFVHWPHELPWLRWWREVRHRVRGRRAPTAARVIRVAGGVSGSGGARSSGGRTPR